MQVVFHPALILMIQISRLVRACIGTKQAPHMYFMDAYAAQDMLDKCER